MNDERKDLLMDHEADGIQELDNLLPRWWLWLFYLTIIFSAIYLGYYHVFRVGSLQIEDYETEMATAASLAPPAEAASTAPTEPSDDAAVLATGKEVFTSLCLPCHLADGGGLVGPNFCDDYFIHGPTYADSIRVVNEGGRPGKGMISWKTQLSPDKIHAVCSYIWTLRGTTPAIAKAPEGEKFEG